MSVPHCIKPRVVEFGMNQFGVVSAIDYHDGEARVTVGWNAEEGQFMAVCSPVPAEVGGCHFGFGNTQADALCDLVVSLMSLTDALHNPAPAASESTPAEEE